ncbi:Dyp-type peroxidase [Sphingomonas sp. PB4P5]|uniref:Dyp-type peroxidase n=1 Tax=Parasphingomonas puruogangriensis TaxID=3096155 RepID=UPI002FCB28A4
MNQAMLTVAARIEVGDLDTVLALIDALGNPAGSIAKALAGSGDGEFLHFASLHAIRSHRAGRAYIVLELSADGAPDAVLGELARRAGDYLTPIFRFAELGLAPSRLAEFLMRHRITVGYQLFQPAGLAFSGVPGLSVQQIEQERALAERVALLLSQQGEFASSLARLEAVKHALAGDPAFAWASDPGPTPPPGPTTDPSLGAKVVALLPVLTTAFLWPILIVAIPLACWIAWPTAWLPTPTIRFLLLAAGLTLVFAFAALLMLYLIFRRGEEADWTSDAAPTLDQAAAMFARENAPGVAHNHMMSHTVRKPGILRFFTLRIAFCAIGTLTGLNPRPGFLGDIGTIHFARWVSIPGTRDVLFFSNYGGSWESYLEDFITRAHEGLTAVWSNTVGFPRTRHLFFDGATDGERFKRFARQSMRYTPFWYSAYPTLTTANIRTNTLVRRGLHARTESEAGHWLTLFGSAPRPKAKLDTTQIQSIMFGGLGFKPAGRLVTVRLGTDMARNRTWVRELMPLLSFNDGRYIKEQAVVTLALAATGLRELGLPEAALETFPAAFLLGMRGEGRARILGDDPGCADWWWDQSEVSAALLIYGDTDAAVAALVGTVETMLAGAGAIVDQIDLTPVGKQLTDRKEPFGFVDGVSQPAIRGTYRGLRNADPIHLIEPGEIILGYPDNRGSVPPGPLLDARDDPTMMLPIAGEDHGFTESIKSNPRLIGFNGSYLVIRQLEQDHDGFWAYCAAQAQKFAHRFPPPAICDAEFIAAKIIGRWPDRSSLARNPYMSATRLHELYGGDAAVATMREQAAPADPAATPIASGDRAGGPASAGGGTKPPVTPDNDFLFGTEDPQGLRCPYGAHVRRANPRDSLSPGSMEQVEITNRHRTLRIGRGFAAQDGRNAGLMFMCLNGDIERQFEFIQQTWMGSTKFHGLDRESDVIAGNGKSDCNAFTIPVRTGPVALDPLPRFVTMRGGGYFFLPGRQLLNYLAVPADVAP